jgi:hypothetical protein
VGSRPGLFRLLAASWLWHFTRFGGLFCCSYLLSKLVDSSLLVQLMGALLFTPMALGVRAGAVTRRVDGHVLIAVTRIAQLPAHVAMFAIVATGHVQAWMLFPFMFVLGAGNLVNMTTERTLIAATAGPTLAVRSLAIDSVSVCSTMFLGPILCGAVIGMAGRAAGFGLLLIAHGSALAVGAISPSKRRAVETSLLSEAAEEHRPGEWRRSLALLRSNAALASVVGITVVIDLLYFSFMPLVPRLAERFDASATLTGALGGTAGFGAFLAALLLASIAVRRLGHVFVIGSAVAFTGLALFAAAPTAAGAFAALFLSGLGNAGFSATQSGLAIESVPLEDRAAAMGIVAMAIGSALPVGMVLLGITSQLVGPRSAVVLSSLTGAALLAVVVSRYPGVLGLTAPPRAASPIVLPATSGT